jgi:prolyl oligopeptidase
MRGRSSLIALTLNVILACALAHADDSDPYLWLEDAHGARAMEWVTAENAKTIKVLEADPRFATMFQEAQQLAEAQDRIPTPQFLGGRIYNFWQDAEHTHGIWRQTSIEDYSTPAPQWRTVLDLDEVSKTEHANWFWGGADCVEPTNRRCLISLSDGGEDASTVREFDLPSGAFVEGGFTLPSGKQDAAWEDPDTLLVAREWVPGEMTQSGYPFVVKRLRRGQAPADAVEVFRGTPADVGVQLRTFHDGSGHQLSIIERQVDFFHAEHYLVGAGSTVKLAMPMNADIIGLIDGRVIVDLHEEWSRAGLPPLPQGSLVAFGLAAARAQPESLHPTLIYAPRDREALVDAVIAKDYLLVHTLDNVNGNAASYRPAANSSWTKRPLALPKQTSLSLIDADLHSDRAFLRTTGFLTPPQLLVVNLGTGSMQLVKELPAKFDASRDVVEQLETFSKDGTRIPYFVVHPAGIKMDGSTPTILNAYGGFLVSRTPQYDPDLGKLWLERGGAYVLANIRGGGEFGPKWHEAGLKTHRQRIYDDFAAVGADLIARGFTSAQRLGIKGGSNGGLLMGVEFTQHPEMWEAVDIEVPLLDMLRYEQIAAGSSWVAEYGSVANPEERQFLASISPYHNLKAGIQYPQALIWTTTKDDRVGPQHARKFAAKLAELKVPYLFYEVVEGGHGAGATPSEHAHTVAMEYAYFASKLMPESVSRAPQSGAGP